MKRNVKEFFHECLNLGDWLAGDPEFPADKDEIDKFIKNHPALKLCHAFSITAKHHTLSSDKKLSAKIAGLNESGSASISVHQNGQDLERVDALDLASSCVTAWRNFINDHTVRYEGLKARGGCRAATSAAQ